MGRLLHLSVSVKDQPLIAKMPRGSFPPQPQRPRLLQEEQAGCLTWLLQLLGCWAELTGSVPTVVKWQKGRGGKLDGSHISLLGVSALKRTGAPAAVSIGLIVSHAFHVKKKEGKWLLHIFSIET